jgi:hypothetical protein
MNRVRPSRTHRVAAALVRLGVSGLAALCLCLLLGVRTNAQTSFQFLPEVDVYYKLNGTVGFDFQAKDTREAGDPTQAEVGPSLTLSVPPLVRLKKVTTFDFDETKSRPLVFELGYRYVPSPDKPTVQRLELIETAHLPLFAGILGSDRNRFDLDWENGEYSWRYRNRLTLERRVSIHSYRPAPYIAAEVFYQSQYSKWTTTALYAGCLLPAGRHLEFNPYYEHQNVTSKSPNQQYSQFGLILAIYPLRPRN